MSDSPLGRLPTELTIAIAAHLDPRSLVFFKSVRYLFHSVFLFSLSFAWADFYLYIYIYRVKTCKVLRDVVRQTPCLQYTLALAAHGLCDGPPSPVTVADRLELVEAYEEAWRTFSWSKHLTLDLPFPHEAPYVSGGTLVLPVGEIRDAVRSFIVQPIPSPLRGVPERPRWRIDLDFVVMCFVIDATQDVLAVVPTRRHDSDITTLVSSLLLSSAYILTMGFVIVHAAYSCVRYPPANHIPSLSTRESFVWRLPNTLRWETANTRYAATFSA